VTKKEILSYSTIDSTNLEAKRLIKSENLSNSFLIAETQTAGRGRFERVWFSPAGKGIYLTAVFEPILTIDAPHLYVILGAVASAWAIEEITKLPVQLKWPNDLMLGGKKVGGILAEVQKTNQGFTPLIGIGINVNTESFPKQIVTLPATSLKLEAKKSFDLKTAQKTLVKKIKAAKKRNFKFLFEEWKARNVDTGRKVRLTIADQVYEGEVKGWGGEGELLLRGNDDKIKAFSAGEIEYLTKKKG
jgi:BirA family biotin operon repressor/biotin-[acetyl-CoA-carboxylase] ligase